MQTRLTVRVAELSTSVLAGRRVTCRKSSMSLTRLPLGRDELSGIAATVTTVMVTVHEILFDLWCLRSPTRFPLYRSNDLYDKTFPVDSP